ncbi:MAG: 50S ribosomal protein L21 [Elusimicrobiales bacterium]|nr:50S ribosomal protein L21 [Elusimicrobiales bacterium]
MYAIIETGGKQYWVTPGELLHVDRLEAKEGEEVNFKAIWSASEEGKEAGKTEAKVTAEVVRHLRGPKIIVFRKKTKKAYEKASGSRQELTEIKVKAIA